MTRLHTGRGLRDAAWRDGMDDLALMADVVAGVGPYGTAVAVAVAIEHNVPWCVVHPGRDDRRPRPWIEGHRPTFGDKVLLLWSSEDDEIAWAAEAVTSAGGVVDVMRRMEPGE